MLGRVIFAPASGSLGSPYTSFTFVANDGLADSRAAPVTINVVLPPAPQFTSFSWSVNGVFDLSFDGDSSATYRVWASTNLVNWEVLGTAATFGPGKFSFTDASTTSWRQRFYRAGAP
ncbi:MAG: hypothetical protein DME18_16595 [Verrucomicrobia bacterium]|nr:MAG: hypothetical protein DME18_16595 [Verrucomicrobiota bacterium]